MTNETLELEELRQYRAEILGTYLLHDEDVSVTSHLGEDDDLLLCQWVGQKFDRILSESLPDYLNNYSLERSQGISSTASDSIKDNLRVRLKSRFIIPHISETDEFKIFNALLEYSVKSMEVDFCIDDFAFRVTDDC